MSNNDALHASISASLVAANLAFFTGLVGSPPRRIFRLTYKIQDSECEVTGYVGGAVLTALAPMRLVAATVASRRHELADVIADSLPMLRVLPHPYTMPPGDENVVWLEAAVPVPPGGEPIEPWLAISPFAAVASGADLLARRFEDVKPTTTASTPLLLSERTEGQPATPASMPTPKTAHD
jgi:hypothetical protein